MYRIKGEHTIAKKKNQPTRILKKPHAYQQQPVTQFEDLATTTNIIKTCLSFQKNILVLHLRIQKSKDIRYLKYFAQQCQEKIENREIAPEKTHIDSDYFVMCEFFLKDTLERLHELTC